MEKIEETKSVIDETIAAKTKVANDYKTPHWIIDEETGEIVNTAKGDDMDHNLLPYYGTLITPGVARKIIRNYRRLNEVSETRPLSFIFGKEGIDAILKQRNCLGIRFYLAYKKENDLKKKEPIANWRTGVTLVAVGVGNDKGDRTHEPGHEPDLGFDDFIFNVQTNTNQPCYPVMSTLSNKFTNPTIIETVPTWP